MWQKPGGRGLPFTAVEEFAAEVVAFVWRARFPLVRVLDRYANEEGLLEVRLLGLVPVARVRGPDVDEGEALRYLAELPWVPYTMAANRELEWRELADRLVEVTTRVRSARAALRLEFDTAGDFVGVAADARPRREGKQIVRRPWAGSFGDYAAVGGVRIPTSGEVRWDLPEGPFTYWRGTITALETG